MEELILKKIRGGLRGLKMGTKTIEEANVMYFLNKLEKVNNGLFQDYILEYSKIQNKYKNSIS